MPLRFQFRRYCLPFRATVRTAHGPWVEREGVIVRLEDASKESTGAAGFGEAAPIPWFGTETADQVEAGCRAIGEWVDETALDAVPARLGCLRHALAGARQELRGQTSAREGESTAGEHESGISAAGGTAERGGTGADGSRRGLSTLPVAALLPAGRAALAQIAPKAAAGFRVFKWKVGVADLADELALLDDVCAELPSGGKLRLDANGAWDRRRAERWLERCADRPVEFVEQPCLADARQGTTMQQRVEDVLLGLASDYPTPIALDESVVGEQDLERWISAGWPGIYIVKPGLIGDLTAALARLEAARAGVVFSSALETAVGARSALKAAFAWADAGTSGEPMKTVRTTPAPAAGLARVAPPVSSGGDAEKANRRRALGFGVWPLFADAQFDGPFLTPYLRYQDVESIKPESVWNALS